DGGGIYLINRQQDLTNHTVVNNEVTGTTATNPSGQVASWGIYLDDWTSGATVKGNYVHGNIGGLFLHGGWNNTVVNNLVAGNTGDAMGLQQSVAWSGWKGHVMSNNEIYHNIFDTSKGTAVDIYGPGGAGTFHDNEYSGAQANGKLFQVWPQVLPSGTTGTLQNWQAAGYDKGSEWMDPHFINPGAGDYTLASNSPAYGEGFVALPFDQMGLLHHA
ncbi:right-handed parallel beta-helix repeat-containing protein, partial [Azospirillum picis]